ncbi:RHS repeat domain-containing protein [Nonlabens xiamenensis]|uniref:RHS repeat domain-containing protein n=1 Tax=Nonlabens xiamenensis TaxID=2341043 RepID=UPI0013DDA712|nr:RHS repeat-associated core domain-containing protein [Nonlabens xiamenensis]
MDTADNQQAGVYNGGYSDTPNAPAGQTQPKDFVYGDYNGNLTADRNKDIASINYNHLNLLTSINFENGQAIRYTYDATGVKLKKEIFLTPPASVNPVADATTYYAGNYIYEVNGGTEQLAFFSHEEGYVEQNGSSFDYVYQYKDHLGNVRLSYADNNHDGSVNSTEIREENNYYPFGLQHKGYNNVVNGRDHKYGFGGKEEQDELGLEWIDITARNYDPALGRWMNIDPLAEQMRRHSPYNYAFDNPIYFMDPDGMAPQTELFNLKGEKIGEDANGIDGNVSIIGDSKKAKAIRKSYKRYKKGKSGGSLASQADVESGYQTTKVVLNAALGVLKRTIDNGGNPEESSIVKADGTVVDGDGSYQQNGDVAEGKLPAIPLDEKSSSTSIHGHGLNATITDDGFISSNDARVPGPSDPTAFSEYKENIIVGRLGTHTGTIDPDGSITIDEKKPPLGAAFFGNNITVKSKPILTLTKEALEKITKI